MQNILTNIIERVQPKIPREIHGSYSIYSRNNPIAGVLVILSTEEGDQDMGFVLKMDIVQQMIYTSHTVSLLREYIRGRYKMLDNLSLMAKIQTWESERSMLEIGFSKAMVVFIYTEPRDHPMQDTVMTVDLKAENNLKMEDGWCVFDTIKEYINKKKPAHENPKVMYMLRRADNREYLFEYSSAINEKDPSLSIDVLYLLGAVTEMYQNNPSRAISFNNILKILQRKYPDSDWTNLQAHLDVAVIQGWLVKNSSILFDNHNDYDAIYSLVEENIDIENIRNNMEYGSHTVIKALAYGAIDFRTLKKNIGKHYPKDSASTTHGLREALSKLVIKGLVKRQENATGCVQPASCEQVGGTCWWHSVQELLHRNPSIFNALHPKMRRKFNSCPVESTCPALPHYPAYPAYPALALSSSKVRMNSETLRKIGFSGLADVSDGEERGSANLFTFNLLNNHSDIKVERKVLRPVGNDWYVREWADWSADFQYAEREATQGEPKAWSAVDDRKDLILAALLLDAEFWFTSREAKEAVLRYKTEMSPYYTLLGGTMHTKNHVVAFTCCKQDGRTRVMLCNWGVCRATNGIHNFDEQEEEGEKLVFNITFWLKPISGPRIQNKRKLELDEIYTRFIESIPPLTT